MIKSKPCIVDGCEYPRFAKGYCKPHQGLRTDKKSSLLHKKLDKKPIKKVSAKQSKSNKAVAIAKAKVIQEWVMAHGRVFCSSCGTNRQPIDPSHVVPISDNKSLEAESEIIFLQCREECHAATEIGSPKMKSFLNYDEIMAYCSDNCALEGKRNERGLGI